MWHSTTAKKQSQRLWLGAATQSMNYYSQHPIQNNTCPERKCLKTKIQFWTWLKNCPRFGGLTRQNISGIWDTKTLDCYCSYRQISNIRGNKSQNFNASRLALQLSLPIPLNPGVIRERRYCWSSTNCIWVINNFFAYQGCLLDVWWYPMSKGTREWQASVCVKITEWIYFTWCFHNHST